MIPMIMELLRLALLAVLVNFAMAVAEPRLALWLVLEPLPSTGLFESADRIRWQQERWNLVPR